MEKIEIPNIEISQSGRLMEGLAIIFLVAIWIFAAVSYGKLPERIPIHFNAMGEVDGIGSKKVLFILPAICTLIYGLFSFIPYKKMPVNVPVKITRENVERQYRLAYGILRYIKCAVMFFFLVILWALIDAAQKGSAIPGYIIALLILGLLVVPVFATIYRMIRSK